MTVSFLWLSSDWYFLYWELFSEALENLKKQSLKRPKNSLYLMLSVELYKLVEKTLCNFLLIIFEKTIDIILRGREHRHYPRKARQTAEYIRSPDFRHNGNTNK